MLLAILLLSLFSIAYQHDTRLDKRWYSVDHLRKETRHLRGPWPNFYGDGTTPIRFCFEDENSYDKLLALVQDAIGLWKPALDVSTLTIEPSCGRGNWHCICDEDTHWDTLTIVDVTDEEGGKTVATLGHKYVKPEDRERVDGRYTYHFLAVKRDEPEGFSRWWDLHGIAHEFGHVAGLDHEHQRPDAEKKGFWWNCDMLKDAASVRQRIADREEGTYEEGDTFERACREFDMAYRYGFSATAIMPKPAKLLGAGVRSKELDWDSIMIYPSYRGEKRLSEEPKSVRFPEGAYIHRRYYEGTKIRDVELLPGHITVDPVTRRYDYSTVRISEGDIARIAQLYPRGKPAGGQAEAWEQAEDRKQAKGREQAEDRKQAKGPEQAEA
ncbi:hypothetical protein AC578_7470 [Pseudocercospora eumusae]|uniref:Peptidase metallopeptidase domain-containing protein n=1 Tax=Pseudocercospora eumusae TaxID=321146 RepID=A0A139H8Y6_9PEZI|nr:hypothetical protein AC578_7470 [Pseudocercospora eumusae]